MKKPLVSVICLCYNHERFVEEALQSVLFQNYPNLEIIIVDDASTDQSVAKINKFIEEIPAFQEASSLNSQAIPVKFIQNKKNLGNCKSFNQALQQAQGKYVIDWATDDVMRDTRITLQVEAFERLGEDYALVFSNALEINEEGKVIKYHYPVGAEEKSQEKVPEGDVYQKVLEGYFICTATMMMRKSVLDELGGYDEELSYEDFDFWVRSSRKYFYYYLDEVTCLKRVLQKSHSSGFYQENDNPHLSSTLKVCQKAFQLNRSEAENKALAKCIQYHLRQSFFTQNFSLVQGYYQLLTQLDETYILWSTRWALFLSTYRVKVFPIYKYYLRLRHQVKL